MNALALKFPVISIAPRVGPHALPGQQDVDFFVNERDFATCTGWDLKFHARDGMFLADSAGCCWRIVSVRDLGITGSFWSRVFRLLLQQSVHQVCCELEEVETLSVGALRERVCAAIASDPDRWRDDEAVAGEDGPPRDEQEMLDELLETVRGADSVPQIINALFHEHLPD